MKKIILAAAIALTTTVSFANTPAPVEDVKVSYAARQSFIREFGQVQNVTWKESNSNLYRATFELYAEKVSAFFTNDGRMVATTTEKDFDQMPGKLRSTITKKLGKADISEIFELNTDEESCYYFKATFDGKSKIYKGYSNGSFEESAVTIR